MVRLDELVTATYPLEDINAAMAAMRRGALMAMRNGGLIAPRLDTGIVNIFLAQLSRTLEPDVQVVLVWDGTGYHRSHDLICPANSRGAWISHGGRMMIWLIEKFQPKKRMMRLM